MNLDYDEPSPVFSQEMHRLTAVWTDHTIRFRLMHLLCVERARQGNQVFQSVIRPFPVDMMDNCARSHWTVHLLPNDNVFASVDQTQEPIIVISAVPSPHGITFATNEPADRALDGAFVLAIVEDRQGHNLMARIFDLYDLGRIKAPTVANWAVHTHSQHFHRLMITDFITTCNNDYSDSSVPFGTFRYQSLRLRDHFVTIS